MLKFTDKNRRLTGLGEGLVYLEVVLVEDAVDMLVLLLEDALYLFLDLVVLSVVAFVLNRSVYL